MTQHLSNEPLMGVAVYNPGILSKDELIRLFVARRGLLQQIIDDLRREKPQSIPQHRLLVGARGMGKSTLLRRVSYAIEDDPELGSLWIPLTFPEEQYNVARLSDLWLNCLDALSDALERVGKHDEAQALDDVVDSLPGKDEEERARKALNVLLEHAQAGGRRLLLLIDNIDLILDRLSKEHWTIREMLAKEGAPLLIGATSRPLEPTYVYQGAFYDFFKINNLDKLKLEEMHGVLETLATECNAPQVAKLLKDDPARIRVLYDLTGGNPRTTVLLFGVLAQGIDGDVRTDLERLLDQCTPLYKARFEELSNQAQQVIDALALNWDPATAATVAEKARLDVNVVSSNLNRLCEQGVVEKVKLFPKKKTGFQLSERFFNIWYLMRASRRMRRKLIWLTKFLKSFYTQEDLRSIATRYVQKPSGLDWKALVKHAEYSFALAAAVEDEVWRKALEHTATNITLEIEREFCDLLGESAIEKDEVDDRALAMRDIRKSILNAQVEWKGLDKEAFADLFCEWPFFNISNKLAFVELLQLQSEKFDLVAWDEKLRNNREAVVTALHDESLSDAFFEAVRTGIMARGDDVEGARSAVLVLNDPRLLAVALTNSCMQKRDEASMEVLQEHLSHNPTNIPWFWRTLGEIQQGLGLQEAAERTFRMALKLFSADMELATRLGSLLAQSLRTTEAVSILQEALAIVPNDPTVLVELGFIKLTSPDKDAEVFFRRAIAADPDNVRAWTGLGAALAPNDDAAAQECFARALSLSPDDPTVLSVYGGILEGTSRLKEAEMCYRKVLALLPSAYQELRLATVLVRDDRWGEVEVFLPSTLQKVFDQLTPVALGHLLLFLRSAITARRITETIELLAKADVADAYRPITEALHAVKAGSKEYLLNAAPEVRNAAEKIYVALVEGRLDLSLFTQKI